MNKMETVLVNSDKPTRIEAKNEHLIIHNTTDYRVYWSYNSTGPWIPLAPLDYYEIKGEYDGIYIKGSTDGQQIVIERRGGR